MAKIKNSGTTNAGKDVEELDYTHVADENVKCYGHSGQQSFLSSPHLLKNLVVSLFLLGKKFF